MAIPKEAIRGWLDDLPTGCTILIDGDSLTLEQADNADACLKVGGIPKEEAREEESSLPTFEAYISALDDVPVVFVNTSNLPEDARGPIIRIYLNDEAVYENPVFPTST